MPKSLKLYIAGVVVTGAIALVATTLVFPVDDAIGIADFLPREASLALGILFWVALALVTSALPVKMPRGTLVAVSVAPILAAIELGGPAVGAWVAALGTTEIRELRGRIPWYGTLANHAGLVVPAALAGTTSYLLQTATGDSFLQFVALLAGAAVFFVGNGVLTATLIALRTDQDFRVVLFGDARGFATSLIALAPLAWLMAKIYGLGGGGWWATLLFALPLYTTRAGYRKFVEMRDMFTQTIGALAQAVDKRDPFTALHSHNVKEIAVDIGRVMRVSDAELEALEWGGLLHDVGKIGVPDKVLLKQDRLTKEERVIMNAHPVKGAEIIAPVEKLAPELPIIRHHHEWFNGSGYPDRLIGDEIPKLARILHVADAFEAMTAARPYRMTPLTREQALHELRKFAGIQFDPVIVDAFVKTRHVDGVEDPGRMSIPRPIPLIGQAAARMSGMPPEQPATERGGGGV
ncbi:MAG: HD-GYP domain-containing protein [Candidatus Limnocylindria bacterium]